MHDCSFLYRKYQTCKKKQKVNNEAFMNRQLTAIIEKEGAGFVSLCPELDIASQGDTIQEAKANLKEALDLFFECASPEEIKQRLHDEIFITNVEVAVG